MKTLKLLLLPLVALAGTVNGRGESSRTNINPALLYYRAFRVSPNLSQPDSDFLYVSNNWRGQKLPERFGELMDNYDNEFKLARQAAQSSAPCDWGIDMS